MKIVEFEEKPKHPKSTNASMGIYIFNKSLLEKYLIEDEADPTSSNDFGKNIIPKMLADGCAMYAYPFEGYWRDVGTIASLWDANMDLIGDKPEFDLSDKKWRIYSRNSAQPPQYVGEKAKVSNSLITEGCIIEGIVENSILSGGVVVEEGAYIKDSVIMSGVKICANATVNYSIIDENVEIGENCVVGRTKSTSSDVTIVGAGLTLPEGSNVPGGEMVNQAWLDGKK